MEVVVTSQSHGATHNNVVVGSSVKIDLTAYAGGYIKIISDQDLYHLMKADNTGTMLVTGAIRAAGTEMVPDRMAGGIAGSEPVFVERARPWLHLQAISATATDVTIKPTSQIIR